MQSSAASAETVAEVAVTAPPASKKIWVDGKTKRIASFDDENSGEGNSPLERAGEAAFVRTCCRAMLQGHGCAEHSD